MHKSLNVIFYKSFKCISLNTALSNKYSRVYLEMTYLRKPQKFYFIQGIICGKNGDIKLARKLARLNLNIFTRLKIHFCSKSMWMTY